MWRRVGWRWGYWQNLWSGQPWTKRVFHVPSTGPWNLPGGQNNRLVTRIITGEFNIKSWLAYSRKNFHSHATYIIIIIIIIILNDFASCKGSYSLPDIWKWQSTHVIPHPLKNNLPFTTSSQFSLQPIISLFQLPPTTPINIYNYPLPSSLGLSAH
jgi:hypothetical protein